MGEVGPLVTRRRCLQGAGALGVLLLANRVGAAEMLLMTVHKDANCGCCTVWAERMRATGRFKPRLIDVADMAAVKARLGVPPELASCHTVEVGGYVVEGHVPAADVLQLLSARPKGIVGLAVPGMPAGSPGMEMPDGRRDPYEVIAFTADGRGRVFARHS